MRKRDLENWLNTGLDAPQDPPPTAAQSIGEALTDLFVPEEEAGAAPCPK